MTVPSEKDWHRLIETDGARPFIKGSTVTVQEVVQALAQGETVAAVCKRLKLSVRSVKAAISIWKAAIDPDGLL